MYIQFLPFGGFLPTEDSNSDNPQPSDCGEQEESDNFNFDKLADTFDNFSEVCYKLDLIKVFEANEVCEESEESCEATCEIESFEVPEITWDLIDYSKESNLLANGGGKQINVTKGKVDIRIREVVEKLASGMSQKKIKGSKSIDCLQFIKNTLKFNYSLPKYDYKPKKVYLFIDTSGSVSYLANLIITIILSCKNSSNIRVISGSEALPDKDEQSGKEYDFRHNNRILDVQLAEFIKLEQPSFGSQFIFWGDIEMGNYGKVRPNKLKEVLFPYKSLWLCSEEARDDKDYNGIKAVMKIKNNVNTVMEFVNNLKL